MQRAVLAGVNIGDIDFARSMSELKSLVEACDIDPVISLTQNLEKINPSTYIGSGKLPELKSLIEVHESTLLIVNDELSPSQIRNLEDELDVKVMDRTMLILEIFSRRAKTREAKLQVDVANLQYMLPRLIGADDSLEQQTGGVGTTNRGSGEKALELNRRQIQMRISRLRAELREAVENRKTQRRLRKKSGIPVVSLVGYTNAGKSTVMNSFLELSGQDPDKKVFEKNMLFATLETSVRSIMLSDNKQFLLSDTVGFIDRLPTHLVKAFRSTLEEALDADLIVIVIDASDPDYENEKKVTESTLADIGVEGIPIIYAYNKIDLVDIKPFINRENSVYISAKKKDGMENLLAEIKKQIFGNYVSAKMLIPYKDGSVISYLQENANIIKTEYKGDGTYIELELKEEDFLRFKEFSLAE